MLDWKYIDGMMYVSGEEILPSFTRNIADLRPVLYDPAAEGEGIAYTVYRDIDDPDKPEDMQADITVLNSGTIGREYLKTHGHYHLGDGTEHYRLLSGEGLMIMQHPGGNFSSVEAVRIIKLSPSLALKVPSGWGHNIVNTGGEPLITVNYQGTEIKPLYRPYEEKRGAAYYVVDESGSVKYLPNKNYGEVPNLQTF